MNKLEDYNDERLASAVNPFVVNLRIPAMRGKTGLHKKADDGIVLPETYLVDRTPYTRIIHAPGNKERVFNLSNKALRLYTYILYNMDQGKDYVQLNIDNYKRRMEVSSDNTFLDAKKELIRYAFIAATEYKTVFWINPDIFFPGNRVKRFPECADIIYEK